MNPSAYHSPYIQPEFSGDENHDIHVHDIEYMTIHVTKDTICAWYKLYDNNRTNDMTCMIGVIFKDKTCAWYTLYDNNKGNKVYMI